VVYQATDTKLHRTVALKFMPRDLLREPQAKARFFQEARAASSLDHTNICTIHDIDETADSQVFICMASYEGETLEQKLRNGPLSQDTVLDYAIQISRGLAEAHNHGIIHRDIKPGNIFVTDKGEVKILDFGLAKLSTGQDLTQIGGSVGTPAYMSPEQLIGETVDHRTDIWAMGVLLYEMLTGVHPFKQPYEQATMYGIMNNSPDPINSFNTEISDNLVRLVEKCLHKDAGQRFESMDFVSEQLTAMQSGTNTNIISDEPEVQIAGRRSQKLKVLTPVIGGLFSILVIILISTQTLSLFSPAGGVAADMPDKMHLAILPFNIIGDNPADQAFCDGLNEILVNRLTQIEQYKQSLLVIPTSEILNQDIRTVEAAQKRFGITLAITGSFQRFGDMVRITQNLVDAKTLRQIRASEVTDQISQTFLVQDGLYAETLKMLQIELDPEEQIQPEFMETAVPGANEYYIQGRGYLQRYEDKANITNAIQLFKQSIQVDSTFALAYASLGEAYWRLYEVTKDIQWTELAVEYSSIALERNKNLEQAYITLAMIRSGQGQYTEAMESLETAMEANSDNPATLRLMAQVYEELGELSRAESIYKNAIGLKPDYWAGYNELGVYYLRRGRFNEALQQFEMVTRLTPDNYMGYRNIGAVYAFQQDWKMAIQYFEQSIDIQPSYSALANIGTSYFYTMDYINAAMYFEKALDQEDNDYRIWGFLADSYYWGYNEPQIARNHYETAIEKAEEQLRVNPDNLEVLADLGAYYSMIIKREDALSIVKQIEAVSVTDFEIMARLAEIYENLNLRDQALQWINKAKSAGYTLTENQPNPSFKNLVADERFRSGE